MPPYFITDMEEAKHNMLQALHDGGGRCREQLTADSPPLLKSVFAFIDQILEEDLKNPVSISSMVWARPP